MRLWPRIQRTYRYFCSWCLDGPFGHCIALCVVLSPFFIITLAMGLAKLSETFPGITVCIFVVIMAGLVMHTILLSDNGENE